MSDLEATRGDRLTTACHEAGHAAAAVALGLGFTRVSIARQEDAAGQVEGVPYPDPDQPEPAAVERYLTYLFAGAAAVREVLGPEVLTGASGDRLQAEYWAGRVFREPLPYRAALERARAQARQIVSSRRAGIQALAAALLDRQELRADEVRALLAQGE